MNDEQRAHTSSMCNRKSVVFSKCVFEHMTVIARYQKILMFSYSSVCAAAAADVVTAVPVVVAAAAAATSYMRACLSYTSCCMCE